MSKHTKQEREEALARLREILPPGTTVYGVVRSVARSGMSRRIDFYAIDPGLPGRTTDKHVRPSMLWLTGLVAKVLDLGRAQGKDGVRVNGCGMNMIFATVYELSNALGYKGKDALRSEGL